jgi:phosphatidylserine decarboxylase
MLIYNRELKKVVDEVDTNAKSVKLLYNNFFGRVTLKIATKPTISKLNGIRYSKKRSARSIPKFVLKNEIDMSEYPNKEYSSFNDFFTRKILEEKRPISNNKKDLISPCDSLLTVYKISDDLTFNLKNSTYTVKELLQDEELAKKYNNGYLLLFRLTVRDYHHYCYIDDGTRDEYKRIDGILHTVNPIACKKVKVYSENSREYTTLHTDNFGDVIHMEVGALMVGKIKNNSSSKFKRGDEKGYFEFGASTIIMLFEQNKIEIDEDILTQSEKDIEVRVKYGETIGKSLQK